MAHGGKREGAGRKPGAVTKKTREIAEKAAAEGITPLEVMLGTMRELWGMAERGTIDQHPETGKVMTSMDYRIQAAEVAQKAAPFVHAKLANVQAEVTGLNGGPMQIERVVREIVDPTNPDAS